MTEANYNNYKDNEKVEITYIKNGKEVTRKIPEYVAYSSNVVYEKGGLNQ